MLTHENTWLHIFLAKTGNRWQRGGLARKHFRILKYKDHNRPKLKFLVRSNVTGKRQRRFFETEAEAKTYAAQKEIELLNQGKEGMTFSTALRVMAQQAAEQLKPFGKTIDDAAQFYLKHLESEKGSVPVEQAVAELIQNRHAAGRSGVYCGDLKFRLGRFSEKFYSRSIASITTREINQWLESLEVGPVTRNTFRRDVRTLFSFCSDHGYCVDNPATATTRAKEPSTEVSVLSVEDAVVLLEKSSPEMLPYWAIGLFAGLRPSEIRKLQWSDVDLDDALITVRSGKTGRKRFVMMQPNLIAWVACYRKHKGPVAPLINFRRQSEADRRGAGLLDLWPVNAMRHSFGSYWLAQFKDVNKLALEMGNSPTVIERHYKRAVKAKEAHRYWEIMPSADAAKKIVTFASQ
jgi:integrase